MTNVNVLLVDDQYLVREGIASLLALEDKINLGGKAGNGKEGIEKTLEQKIDIVILDIRMPEMNGVEATVHIKQKHPNCKIIMLTTFDQDKDIRRMLENGADGYMLKDKGKEELVGALHQVYAGHHYVPPRLLSKFLRKPKPKKQAIKLGKREREVLSLLMEGLQDKEIAARLHIATTTVETHCRNMRRKTKTKNRVQLVNYAQKHKLFEVS